MSATSELDALRSARVLRDEIIAEKDRYIVQCLAENERLRCALSRQTEALNEKTAMLVGRAVYRACAAAEFGEPGDFTDWNVSVRDVVTEALRAARSVPTPPERKA